MVKTNDMRQQLATHTKRVYFERLVSGEPAIDWHAWAARVYRKSHSVNSILTYSYGIGIFREFLRKKNSLTLANAVATYKKNERDIYADLDDFVTYCDAELGVRPRTIIGAYSAMQNLLAFAGIELSETKLKAIVLPQAKALNDEYPENEPILRVLSCASPVVRGYVQVICDTGFEPIDAAQLKVEDLRLDEDPVRITKDREKTGQHLEGFLSKTTVEALMPLIKDKTPDDFIFTNDYKQDTVDLLRAAYNRAVARAGFGKVNEKRHYSPDKIKGHAYGTMHLKVYKKRWFTLAITSGVPEYVAQGMLGRKQYLDQYMRLPLETKRDYAKKILAKVNVYSQPQDTQAVKQGLAQLLGLDNVTDDQLKQAQTLLKGLLRLPMHEQAGIIAKAANQASQD